MHPASLLSGKVPETPKPYLDQRPGKECRMCAPLPFFVCRLVPIEYPDVPLLVCSLALLLKLNASKRWMM